MSAQNTLGPRAFDSAYPGSMNQREDGDYIRRYDPTSLAAALLEGIAQRDRQIEDLTTALTAALWRAKAHDELMEALQLLADVYDAMGAPRGPARIKADAAITKTEGNQS